VARCEHKQFKACLKSFSKNLIMLIVDFHIITTLKCKMKFKACIGSLIILAYWFITFIDTIQILILMMKSCLYWYNTTFTFQMTRNTNLNLFNIISNYIGTIHFNKDLCQNGIMFSLMVVQLSWNHSNHGTLLLNILTWLMDVKWCGIFLD
jgi:hypothetical protein